MRYLEPDIRPCIPSCLKQLRRDMMIPAINRDYVDMIATGEKPTDRRIERAGNSRHSRDDTSNKRTTPHRHPEHQEASLS